MRKSLIVLLAALAVPSAAWACAVAVRPKEFVQISAQSILVTWNAKTKVEHFVRRARFEGATSKDFGFLVPTPSKPDLAESDDGVFERLLDLTKPEHVKHYVPDFMCLLLPIGERRFKEKSEPRPNYDWKTAEAGPAVTVLEEKRVAGLDAAVLEATDAKALVDWLKEHEYASRPELEDWAQPYIAAKWKITAFKLAAGAPAIRTAALRMTFTTDEPLFPYRVPTDQRKGNGLLRVFFVGSEKVFGKLGREVNAWAPTTYASENSRVTKALEGAIPKEQMPDGLWLSFFEDGRWPSSGDDLYFKPDPSQAPVVPPPIIDDEYVPIPVDLVAAVVLLGGWIVWRMRRRKK
jgi:Uncharacterized protein conserved in bacteria (DUF2330)